MPTAAQVEPLRRNLATVGKLARRELEGFWRTLDLSDMVSARRSLEDFFPVLISQYGDIAAIVAADWYEDIYREAARMAPQLADGESVNSRMRWAIGAGFGGDSGQALATLGIVTDELVKQFGRDTVVLSSSDNNRAYARVPTGSETCAFCLMLASRGFAYATAQGAGELSKFHGDCDCTIIASDGVDPEGYDPDALYEKYMNARQPGDSTKESLKNLRDELGTH